MEKKSKAATTVTVTRTYRASGKDVSEEQDSDNLNVRTFVTEPAKVRLGYGLTINMGNYESARVEVSIEVPCYAEEVDAAYAYAEEWVTRRIESEKKNVETKRSNSVF